MRPSVDSFQGRAGTSQTASASTDDTQSLQLWVARDGQKNPKKSLQQLQQQLNSPLPKTNQPKKEETKNNCATKAQEVILDGGEEDSGEWIFPCMCCGIFVTHFYSLELETRSRILTPASELPFHFHIKVGSLQKENTWWIPHEIVWHSVQHFLWTFQIKEKKKKKRRAELEK